MNFNISFIHTTSSQFTYHTVNLPVATHLWHSRDDHFNTPFHRVIMSSYRKSHSGFLTLAAHCLKLKSSPWQQYRTTEPHSRSTLPHSPDWVAAYPGTNRCQRHQSWKWIDRCRKECEPSTSYASSWNITIYLFGKERYSCTMQHRYSLHWL